MQAVSEDHQFGRAHIGRQQPLAILQAAIVALDVAAKAQHEVADRPVSNSVDRPRTGCVGREKPCTTTHCCLPQRHPSADEDAGALSL
jgi:hypothetical protein